MTAKEFLDTEDKMKPSSFDNQMRNWTYTESQLTAFAERYHQAKLKLLGIADVVGQSEQLPCGDCKPMEYDVDGIRYFKCKACGKPMK